jgi:hypothetical protein
MPASFKDDHANLGVPREAIVDDINKAFRLELWEKLRSDSIFNPSA